MPSKAVVFCSPELASEMQARIEHLGWTDKYRVEATDKLPKGQVQIYRESDSNAY